MTIEPTGPGAPDKRDETSAALPGAYTQAASWFVQLLGQGSAQFSAALVGLGTAFAIFTVAARLEDPKAWEISEFLPSLGFGALLVMLGFIEEMFVVRASRRPKSPEPSTPPASPNGQATTAPLAGASPAVAPPAGSA